MRKSRLEKRLKNKAAQDIPDVLDSIKNTPEYRQFIEEAQTSSNRRTWLKRSIPALASLTALFVLGIFLFNPAQTPPPTEVVSSIQMEINPSFSIDLNSNDEVLALNAYNEDAQTLLENESPLIGQDLDTAIDTLITRSIDLGYMSEHNSDVLFSIASENSEKIDALKERIEQKVRETAARNGIDNAHMMQSVAGPPGEGEIENAREHGMGFMQMRLVNLILEKTDAHTLETLEEKNILQLRAILEVEGIDQDDFGAPMHRNDEDNNMPGYGKDNNMPGPRGNNSMPSRDTK